MGGAGLSPLRWEHLSENAESDCWQYSVMRNQVHPMCHVAQVVTRADLGRGCPPGRVVSGPVGGRPGSFRGSVVRGGAGQRAPAWPGPRAASRATGEARPSRTALGRPVDPRGEGGSRGDGDAPAPGGGHEGVGPPRLRQVPPAEARVRVGAHREAGEQFRGDRPAGRPPPPAWRPRSRSAVPSVSQPVAASRAYPVVVHAPERSAEASRPASAGGVIAKPVVSPGASRLDRLSARTTRSGAYAASGGGASSCRKAQIASSTATASISRSTAASSAAPPVRHGERQRVVQGRLDVHRVQRPLAVRGEQRVRPQALRVARDRHEGDPEPDGERLHHRVRELLHADPSAGGDQRGQGGGDGLPAVPGEEHGVGGRRPVRPGQQRRDRLAGRAGAPHAGRPQRRLQHVGPGQPGQARGQQLRLAGHGRVVELQVDAAERGLGQRGSRGGGRRPDEGAAPHLADHQSAPGQLAVDPARRGVRDAVPPRERPLRRQPVARAAAVPRRSARPPRPPPAGSPASPCLLVPPRPLLLHRDQLNHCTRHCLSIASSQHSAEGRPRR